jgi:NADPH-dependent curcumin reductase CurA
MTTAQHVLARLLGMRSATARLRATSTRNAHPSHAAGAAGSFAIQFGREQGAFIVTTAGSQSKADVASRIGANVVIKYKEEENMQQAFAEACPSGFDVVMDGVGSALQEAYLPNLKRGAKVLLGGYISEYPHNAGAPLRRAESLALREMPPVRCSGKLSLFTNWHYLSQQASR